MPHSYYNIKMLPVKYPKGNHWFRFENKQKIPAVEAHYFAF